jgi:hypothetical protein
LSLQSGCLTRAVYQIADSSVRIAFLRDGRAEQVIQRSLRTRSILLSAVAACELYLGATNREDKRDLDRIRLAFTAASLLAVPTFEDCTVKHLNSWNRLLPAARRLPVKTPPPGR